MTTVIPMRPVGRTWASIVLARQSQLPQPQESEVLNQLSNGPGRPDAGQMDRSISTFEISRAAVSHSGGDGGVRIPRDWADGLSRLEHNRPPADVPLSGWHQLIVDISVFVSEGWAARARALGWELHDLIGADPDRPFARIDRAGLLWLLNGNRLIALSENTATVETKSGARQTYRRKPHELGRVLAWELLSRQAAVG
jgi:hypothetical protein